MKKVNLLFLLAGFFAVSFLASCESDGVDNPLLTLTPANDFTAEPGTTTTISVIAGENPSSKSKLKELEVDADGGTSEDVTEALNGSTFSGSYDFLVPADGVDKVIAFKLTDKAGGITEKSITITGQTSVTTTPLGAATAFSMVRCGANDPTEHGLQFDQVTGSGSNFNAVIVTSTADKLVELSSGEWTSITTQEDLMDAVDNGTASSTFSMATPLGGGSLDKVVATKEGSTYTLIHFTGHSNATCTGGSTEWTLNGESKE